MKESDAAFPMSITRLQTAFIAPKRRYIPRDPSQSFAGRHSLSVSPALRREFVVPSTRPSKAVFLIRSLTPSLPEPQSTHTSSRRLRKGRANTAFRPKPLLRYLKSRESQAVSCKKSSAGHFTALLKAISTRKQKSVLRSDISAWEVDDKTPLSGDLRKEW